MVTPIPDKTEGRRTAVVPTTIAICGSDNSADSDDETSVAIDQSKWFSGPQWSNIPSVPLTGIVCGPKFIR
jgi:hypothetical protein